jgi:hypothetical protein
LSAPAPAAVPQVVDSFGESHVYPDLSSRHMEVTSDYINSIVGVQLDAPTSASLLSKMQLRAVGCTELPLLPPLLLLGGRLRLVGQVAPVRQRRLRGRSCRRRRRCCHQAPGPSGTVCAPRCRWRTAAPSPCLCRPRARTSCTPATW